MGKGKLGLVLAARRWNEAQARMVVEAWRRRGGSMRQAATAWGISEARLGRWARHFGGTAGVVSSPGVVPDQRIDVGGVEFVRVRTAASELAEALGLSATAPACGIVLTCGGDLRVEIRPGFDRETLRAVLDVLDAEGATC